MKYIYDEEGDVLYAFMGNPRESIYDSVGNGIYLRKGPAPNQYIGFMILNFSKRLHAHQKFSIPHFEKIKIPPLKEITI